MIGMLILQELEAEIIFLVNTLSLLLNFDIKDVGIGAFGLSLLYLLHTC